MKGDFEPGASARRLILSVWLVWGGGGLLLIAMLFEDVEGGEDVETFWGLRRRARLISLLALLGWRGLDGDALAGASGLYSRHCVPEEFEDVEGGEGGGVEVRGLESGRNLTAEGGHPSFPEGAAQLIKYIKER